MRTVMSDAGDGGGMSEMYDTWGWEYRRLRYSRSYRILMDERDIISLMLQDADGVIDIAWDLFHIARSSQSIYQAFYAMGAVQGPRPVT